MESTKIVVFKGKKIRKTILKNEWWFSVVDVIEALTDSENPRDYWYKMKIRENSESNVQLSTICRQLKLEAPDGKLRRTDCANTEGIFRTEKPFKGSFNVRTGSDLHREAALLAKAKGTTLNTVVTEALEKYLSA